MNLEACLPADLRGAAPTITRIAAGLSGAEVYRVEAAGQVFALKITSADEPVDGWRRKLHTLQAAAAANLAPRVVHADEARRAVLNAFIADRSFPARYGDPRTRDAAIALLGRTVRRVHELPLPPGAEPADPRGQLATVWSRLAGFAVPGFVGEAVQRVVTEEPPPPDRAVVLSHNDINPTNLVLDGDNLLLLDWDTAGPNDPLYDLAAAALFLRMDEAACRALLAAHDGAPAAGLPARFGYTRRLLAVLCGALFLQLARQGGHPGSAGPTGATLDSTPTLAEFYQQLRSGALNVATAEGQWGFGLALVKESAAA